MVWLEDERKEAGLGGNWARLNWNLKNVKDKQKEEKDKVQQTPDETFVSHLWAWACCFQVNPMTDFFCLRLWLRKSQKKLLLEKMLSSSANEEVWRWDVCVNAFPHVMVKPCACVCVALELFLTHQMWSLSLSYSPEFTLPGFVCFIVPLIRRTCAQSVQTAAQMLQEVKALQTKEPMHTWLSTWHQPQCFVFYLFMDTLLMCVPPF